MSLSLRSKLLAWYRKNRRDLPWRRTQDPYRIWVSEIMLQQTRVETVIPYYERFLARFPDVRALARAPQGRVLKLWEGLGYYSRARSLHAAAKVVAREHGGRLPSDPEALRALPGIGPYTAGAVASIAFGKPEPVLDGNVERVLCRLLAVRENPREPAVREKLWGEARNLARGRSPGDLNQALMELGATVCAPRGPACLLCPVAADCRARAAGLEESLPALEKKKAVPRRREAAAVIERGGRVLLTQRPAEGLLAKLWGFPSEPLRQGESAMDCAARIARVLGVPAVPAGELPPVTHVYSHFRLDLRPVRLTLDGTQRRGDGEAQGVMVAGLPVRSDPGRFRASRPAHPRPERVRRRRASRRARTPARSESAVGGRVEGLAPSHSVVRWVDPATAGGLPVDRVTRLVLDAAGKSQTTNPKSQQTSRLRAHSALRRGTPKPKAKAAKSQIPTDP